MKSLFLTICMAAITAPCFSQLQKISECVIEKGVLKKIEVDYNVNTGERTITAGGVVKKFYDLYPQDGPEYAAKSTWYINSEPVTFNGAQFVKYGLPRVLTPFEIIKSGNYKGIGVYTEAGMTEQEMKEVEVIYIPARSGCEFQPYQRELPYCANVSLKADKKEFKAGETIVFTATVTDALGAAGYEWFATHGNVVGNSNGKTFTVSTTGVTDNVLAQVTVYVNGKRCHNALERLVIPLKK